MMRRLNDIPNEVMRKRCSKCDYLNPEVPMTKKKAACSRDGLDYRMKCEIFMRTNRLESRIRYIRGELSGIFICSRGSGQGCRIDTYRPEDEDKVPFYCPVDTCPEYNPDVCPKHCAREQQQTMF